MNTNKAFRSKEEDLEYKKTYREANKDKLKEYNKAYYEKKCAMYLKSNRVQ